jgi:hypothetical protein
MHLGKQCLGFFMSLRNNPYRFYLHDEQSLFHAAQSQGHRLQESKQFGIWQFVLFSK